VINNNNRRNASFCGLSDSRHMYINNLLYCATALVAGETAN